MSVWSIITFLVSSIICFISVVKKKTPPSIDLFDIEYRFLFSNIYFFQETTFFTQKILSQKIYLIKKKGRTLKTQIVTKFRNSSCDNSNSNSDKTPKLNLWQNPNCDKYQVIQKKYCEKISNWDKTLRLKLWLNPKTKLWQFTNSNSDNTQFQNLEKIFW